MSIHAATLAHSPRLQSVLAFLRLRGAAGATTRDLIQATGYCAINSIAAEIRAGGIPVTCVMEARGRFRYRLAEFAPPAPP